MVYSDEIIESESGVFPWKKDDFEEGVPKTEIDPMFNMIPIVFPRNYFYDVCLENKFHRVVGVAITKSDLERLPIETIDRDTSLDDIIGSIRWTIDTSSSSRDSRRRRARQEKMRAQKARAKGQSL